MNGPEAPTSATGGNTATAGDLRLPLDRDAVAGWFRDAGIIEAAIREGEMIADFALMNGRNQRVSVQTLLDRGPLALTFTLGAGSPRCRTLLRGLQRILPEITAKDAALVSITPDPPALALQQADRDGLSFDLLSDRDAHLVDLFGLSYSPPAPLPDWLDFLGLPRATAWPGNTVPLTATYLVAQDGLARYAFVEADPLARVDPLRLVAAITHLCGRDG